MLEYDEASERYDLHDLARAFALARLEDERPARLRHVRYHINMLQPVKNYANIPNRYVRDQQLVVVVSFLKQELIEADAAWLWLLEQNQKDSESETDEVLLALADVTDIINEFCAPAGELIPQLKARVAAAQRLERPDVELKVLNQLGLSYFEDGDYLCAITFSKEAQRLARKLDNWSIESIATHNLIRTYQILGEDEHAADYEKQFRQVCEKIVAPYWGSET
jgi:tetratricopeptide (TPR) repeat protein